MKPAGAPSCFRLGFACRLVLFIACVSVRADIFTTDVTTSTSDTSSTSFPVVRPVVFPTFPNPINLAALPHFNGTLPATVHAYGGQLAIDATGVRSRAWGCKPAVSLFSSEFNHSVTNDAPPTRR